MKQTVLVLSAALLAATGSAQITFSGHTPAEFGIESVLSYTRSIFVDYDQDGHLDFFSNVIYRNDGTGHFTRLDSTLITGYEQVDWADFDNDGYPDLLTNLRMGGTPEDSNYIFIYRNEGPPNWTLRNVSDSLGLGYNYPIYNCDLVDPAWFDYDGDGWLDFYISSYEYPIMGQSNPDHLFHNHGGRYFTEVSDSSLVDWHWRCSRGVSLLDYDEDCDVDVFVSAYRLQANLLLQNNGDGTFWDVAPQKGVDGLLIGGYYGHNIGAAIADYNNDGHMDIFTPITHHEGYPGDTTGHLWISNGPPDWEYTCHFEGSGLINTEIGSNPSYADFDNDGDVDLFYINLYYEPDTTGWLFRNEGDCRFTDVTDSVGLQVHKGKYYGLWCDVNEDGFLDIVWARDDSFPVYTCTEFMMNSGGNGNHWLQVDVASPDRNRSAIGTRLDAWAGELQVTREVLHNEGHHYGSTFIPRQHFGLGSHTLIDSLVIRWPDGNRDVMQDVGVDTILRIVKAPGIAEKPGSRIETGRLEIRTNGYEVEVRLGNRNATVIDAAGRVRGHLRPDAEGLARWQAGSGGVYFVVVQRGTEQQAAKAVLIR